MRGAYLGYSISLFKQDVMLDPCFFFVALVLKVDDCASWSGLLSWLDFYCGRSPSPVIKPCMHGFCVSAGLGPSICAAHVWRSLLSEVSIVAIPAGKPGFFLHAWRPRLGVFMPGSRARSPPPDSLEQVYAKYTETFSGHQTLRGPLIFLLRELVGPAIMVGILLRVLSEPRN